MNFASFAKLCRKHNKVTRYVGGPTVNVYVDEAVGTNAMIVIVANGIPEVYWMCRENLYDELEQTPVRAGHHFVSDVRKLCKDMYESKMKRIA